MEQATRATRRHIVRCESTASWTDQVWCGDFPEIPCVYVLRSYGRVEYVGQTDNLRRRLGEHVSYLREKHFDHVQVAYTEGASERLDLERKFIIALKPRLNKPYSARMIRKWSKRRSRGESGTDPSMLVS